jgi:hypothetical protein
MVLSVKMMLMTVRGLLMGGAIAIALAGAMPAAAQPAPAAATFRWQIEAGG